MLSQTVRSSFVKTGGKKKSKTHLGSDHEGYCYNVFLEIYLGFIRWHLEIADPFHNLEMGWEAYFFVKMLGYFNCSVSAIKVKC